MKRLKWTRKTLRKIAAELRSLGIQVCANTVGRLLREMDYSLRVNRKAIAARSAPERNEQMLHIAELRKRFTRRRAGGERGYEEEGVGRPVQERWRGLEQESASGSRSRLSFHGRGPGDSLWALRPNGELRFGVCRGIARHTGICG